MHCTGAEQDVQTGDLGGAHACPAGSLLGNLLMATVSLHSRRIMLPAIKGCAVFGWVGKSCLIASTNASTATLLAHAH
jgi:hypothetical protein